MQKRRLIFLTAAAVMAVASTWAAEPPQPGKTEPLVQHAIYKAEQVIVLHLKQAHGFAIRLPPNQTKNDTYGLDSAHLIATAKEGSSLIVLKPQLAMKPRAFFIHDQITDKLYTFLVDIVDIDTPFEAAYSLTITDPSYVDPAKAEAWRKWKAGEDTRKLHEELLAASAVPTDTNFKYVLQGKQSREAK